MYLKAMPFKMLPVNLKLRSQFSNFCFINSMMELFLPILGVILSTTTERQIYKVFISLP